MTSPTEGNSISKSDPRSSDSRPIGHGTTLIVLILFVLSGAAGLVYEVIWTRMLTLVFGNTVYAASTVVAAFMGGLAIGSYYFGRLADRRRDVLKIYGLLEAGVGVLALFMPLILSGLNILYGNLFRAFGEQPAPFFVARFVLSFVLLLFPTILMGATLPVLTRFFIRRRTQLGRQVANLYALNTIGATAGCFAAGFFLVEKLGVTATNYLAATISLVVAGLILLMARRMESRGQTALPAGKIETAPSAAPETEAVAGSDGYPARLRRLILVSVALVGFTALGYEVLWTRVIVYVVTATTEAFAVVLTTYLAGIALGSLIVARWVDSWRRLLAVFGAIEIAIGLAVIASIPLLGNLYELSGFASRIAGGGFWGLTAMRFITTFIVVLVPTLLMGAAFPVATSGYIRTLRGVGRGVGSLYALNTVGAVAGSLAAGFIVLPAMGAQNGLMLFALINLVVGVVLWSAEPGRRIRGMAGGTAVAAAGYLLGVLFIPANTFHQLFNQARSQTEMIYCSEGITATVTVHRFPPGTNFQDDLRVICTTGEDVAGTDYMLRTTQMLQGHLPLLLMEPGPRAMQVGFGSGETVRVLLLQGARKLDVVEICEGLVQAAPLFADINQNAYLDPRVRIIFMDAKNYALLTGETYDIILNDSIHPRVSGNASLYTVDYFEDCRRHIAPGGFMSSWFPVYGMHPDQLRMIIRSFQEVFPHATLWMAHNVVNRHAQLLAPVDDVPLRIDYQDYRERFLHPDIQADLAVIDLTDPDFFISSLVMDEDALREFTEGAELNTDEHPLLEYGVPKFIANDEFAWADILESMVPYRSDVRKLLVNLPEETEEREAVERKLGLLYESNGHVVRAMAKGLRGDRSAQEEFAKAEAIYPDHLAVRIARERRDNQLARLRQIARETPDDPGAVAQLGHAYWRAGRLADALRQMETAHRLEPGNPQIVYWLGDLRRKLGDNAGAINEYEAVLALNPKHVGALVNLAFALEADGKLEEAAARYSEAIALGDRRSDLQIDLGMVEERLGHADKAAAAYRLALKWDPESVDALNSLAILETGRENQEEAVSLYRRAIAIDPHHPDAWNNLAWFFAETETNLDEAAKLANQAVRLDPSASSYDTYAWVLFKQGELDRAREAIRKAIELSPGKEASLERLRIIDEALGEKRGG